ncbi:MAG: hypothetical protein ACXWH1_14040 [Thermoanaerobaculia bacterium]
MSSVRIRSPIRRISSGVKRPMISRSGIDEPLTATMRKPAFSISRRIVRSV